MYLSPKEALSSNSLIPETFYLAAARLQTLIQRESRQQGLGIRDPKQFERLGCTKITYFFPKGNPHTQAERVYGVIQLLPNGRHDCTAVLSQDAGSTAGRDVALCLCLLLCALGEEVAAPNASFWIHCWDLRYF